jgi:hypothetical protein
MYALFKPIVTNDTGTNIDLAIFDCEGVFVYSENIAIDALVSVIAEAGLEFESKMHTSGFSAAGSTGWKKSPFGYDPSPPFAINKLGIRAGKRC